jgi:4-hydroxy-3-methylbut-2-en-1-yl diphosphate reductase
MISTKQSGVQADRVLLVAPRGFCAGVEMAVKALAWMVLRFGAPVYCVHRVVHNERLVERFAALGVVFVDRVEDVPLGATVLLSAHGSTPGAVATATDRAAVVVDAVCPLVAKVHHEIGARAAAGDRILYVGHRGHDEAVGALGVAPHETVLVTSGDDIDRLAVEDQPVALLAQTTLAVDDWAAVLDAARDRFGHVWTPRRNDICYATTNRQAALRTAAGQVDAVVVVGSASSANTRALVGVARSAGVSEVVRVDGASELPPGLRAATVAVTAGASAPEEAVSEVVAALRPSTVERFAVLVEDTYFPLPASLRRILAEDPQAAALAERDRTLSADDLLRHLEAVRSTRAA